MSSHLPNTLEMIFGRAYLHLTKYQGATLHNLVMDSLNLEPSQQFNKMQHNPELKKHELTV